MVHSLLLLLICCITTAAAAQALPSSVDEKQTPFRHGTVGVRAGSEGLGAEIATPLTPRLALRGSYSTFHYIGKNFNDDGVYYDVNLHLASARLSVDWHPWNNGFRISPGVQFANNNNVSAKLSVPGGGRFEFGDDSYQSDLNNPVHGNVSIDMKNSAASTLTAGWDSIIPGRHRHWAVPVEFGVAFNHAPRARIVMQGSVCSQGECRDITQEPEFARDIQVEEDKLNNDLHPLRFYPIVSIGFAYRF